MTLQTSAIDPSAAQPGATLTLRKDLTIGDPSDGRVTISDYAANRHYMIAESTVAVLRQFDGERAVPQILSDLDVQGIRVNEDALLSMVSRATTLGWFEESAPEAGTGQVSHLRGPSRRNPLFFKLTERDPSRALDKLGPLAPVLFSRAALAVCIAGLFSSASVLVSNASRYSDDLSAFSDYRVWLFIYGGLFVLTVMHEFGHGLAVHKYGGRVRRMGLVLYLFQPFAYTDTSDAWGFSKSRQRIIVSFAGIYVEAFVVSVCVLGWASELVPHFLGQCLLALAHLAVLRIVLNLNPFLRLDGYWLLSDLIGIPNLRAKAMTVLLSVLAPPAFRNKTTFVRSLEERILLFLYALISVAMVVAGVGFGVQLVNGWPASTFDFYTSLMAWTVASVAAVAVALTAFAYVRSLHAAHFVRSKA